MSIEAIKNKLAVFHQEWEASRGCADMTDFSDDVAFLLDQNQRLVEALEWYANLFDNFKDNIQEGELIEQWWARQSVTAKNALQAYKLLEKKD